MFWNISKFYSAVGQNSYLTIQYFKMINRLKENINFVAIISYKNYNEISLIVRIENNYALVIFRVLLF